MENAPALVEGSRHAMIEVGFFGGLATVTAPGISGDY